MAHSRLKAFMLSAVLLSVVVFFCFYLLLPQPEIVETNRNPTFTHDNEVYSNTTVTIRNNGGTGWVKITANYQNLQKGGEYHNDTQIYMKSGQVLTLSLTNYAESSIYGEPVSVWFVNAQVEAVLKTGYN
jgi:hypothetical protein